MRQKQGGFTLVELLIVIVIIGILVAIAAPNYARMQENAKRASCISNQHNILEAAIVYTMDFVVPDGLMDIEDLADAGYIEQEFCECPSSDVDDFDDYDITWQDDLPKDVTCTVKNDEHDWSP